MRRRSVHIAWGLVGLVAVMLSAPASWAQRTGHTPAPLEGVDVDEQLGSSIPRDVTFYDEEGRAVALGTYLDGERPVILNLVYHDCPMLCNMVVDGLTNALRAMSWTPGAEFDVLTVSFNERETPELAREQKERYVSELGKPAAASGWHFLTGEQEAIETLTEAVGFSFRWVEAQQQFAHPATLIFLSGDGTISRYLYGLEYAPREVRNALVEASEGKVGTVIDQAILYCFQYDPHANSYVLQATNLMKLGGGLTVLVLGVVLFVFWRRERRRLDDDAGAVPTIDQYRSYG